MIRRFVKTSRLGVPEPCHVYAHARKVSDALVGLQCGSVVTSETADNR